MTMDLALQKSAPQSKLHRLSARPIRTRTTTVLSIQKALQKVWHSDSARTLPKFYQLAHRGIVLAVGALKLLIRILSITIIARTSLHLLWILITGLQINNCTFTTP